MIKKLSLIFSFIASYVLIRLFSVDVYAISFPVPSANALNELYQANVNYSMVDFTQFGYWPEVSVVPAITNEFSSSGLTVDPYYVDVSDCSVRPLSKLEMKSLVQKGYTYFFDTEGNHVDLSDVFYVESNNDYFQNKFYVDSTGNMLFYDEGLACMVRYTGAGKVAFSTAIQNIISQIENNNFNWTLNNVAIINNSYYLMFGQTRGGNPSDVYLMYIVNQYNPYRVVPVASNSGEYINRWYANDLSVFKYAHPFGNGADVYSITEGNFTKDGLAYRYQVSFAVGYNFSNVQETGSYGDFIAGVTGLLIKRGLLYNPNYVESIPFSKVQDIPDLPIDGDTPIPVINDIIGVIDVVDPIPTPNENEDDPPVVLPIPDVIPVDPVYPFPVTDEDEEPIEGEGDVIDPEVIGLDLPIISNLQYRFPFSIPFDLYKAFSSFEAEPVTPEIVGTIEFGDFYSWDVDLDLHDFDELALLFRKLILISFIIWLAYFSYDHFFGK